jgi:hypothetical protein
MDEGDKREVEKICWKTIFIAVVLVGIGVVIGRVTAGMCPLSKMGKCGGGYSMKSCWNKGGSPSKCWMAKRCDRTKKSWWKKDWSECREKVGKCKLGCTCLKCSKKSACVSNPDKAGCPMMEKKTVELEKD